MSDSTVTPPAAAASFVSEAKANDSSLASAVPAQEKPAPVEAKEANEATGGADSLEKLLAHISELQRENSELEQAMQYVRNGNIQKLKEAINDKIQPWISGLDIAEEYKTSFLNGIEKACAGGSSKTMSNFEENPVYTVVCSAAAAHGIAIQQLEDTRKKLQEAEESHKADLLSQDKRIQSKTDQALQYASSSDSSRTNKRTHQEISPDAGNSENLWDNMFSTMQANAFGRMN
tara:strand:- start:1738 stop:2436 length:699 start_codon:yes stop_codon:yes gene_type:complete